ncbi:gas vesicle protein K [Streptomyces sp. A0592]|uniref:gas vesicle protein K n=1 Tax=Streptomyces sp. A0592 TaxID=2563099 RepID=UPI00109E7BB0|nr:gas vesicle protein K [Streptomyces sp. A0592]THA75808.1 gas vesicle protein K [Streptomyces sp. A0592]
MVRERPPARHPRLGRIQDLGDNLSQAFRLIQAPPDSHDCRPARRLTTDSDAVGEDLLKLVLTVVELLRQLIERQALRRVDAGDLTDEQEEELGATLLALHDSLADLCAEHGYTLEDLNLDLGPLGPLLPPHD